jgi:uncharacterized protein (TIGR02266 family)
MALQERPPALVLIDDRVVADGALLARIRSVPGGQGVPLVLLASQTTSPELLEAASKQGLDDCILAPLEPRHLQGRLEALQPRRVEAKAASPQLPPSGVIRLLGDDPDLQSQLAALLEHVGYQTARGSELGPGEKPALIILVTDLFTAVGLEQVGRTLKAARKADPTASVSMLLLTSSEVPQGALVHETRIQTLVKSVPPEKVVERVNAMLGRPPEKMRAHERVSFYCPVEFREAGGFTQSPWSSGFSINISAGGLFVKTLVPLRPGAPVELRIRLTTTSEVLPLTGVVAWANRYSSARAHSCMVGMGVQFLGAVSKKMAQLIDVCRASFEAA